MKLSLNENQTEAPSGLDLFLRGGAVNLTFKHHLIFLFFEVMRLKNGVNQKFFVNLIDGNMVTPTHRPVWALI